MRGEILFIKRSSVKEQSLLAELTFRQRCAAPGRRCDAVAVAAARDRSTVGNDLQRHNLNCARITSSEAVWLGGRLCLPIIVELEREIVRDV
ncbi:hypothetical protein EVAR_56175_1 [Eumeta japonica]|uniref:Uncharacterized protein n=1 Tax=Eumeta variegata TaxID=151549 RepID=A0A4C1ZW54_EUMVA|nr:hypothetical protein EVAR_56175_1 [Eumeta japonica]